MQSQLFVIQLHHLLLFKITSGSHFSADKHKMERFLRPDAPMVVSVFAPITFSPAGVLLFKQRSDGEMTSPRSAAFSLNFWPSVALLVVLFDYPLKGAQQWPFSSFVVFPAVCSQASRTWWLQAVCSVVTLSALCWRGSYWADIRSKSTGAQQSSVTCSLTGVRGCPPPYFVAQVHLLYKCNLFLFFPCCCDRWHHVVQTSGATDKMGSKRAH